MTQSLTLPTLAENRAETLLDRLTHLSMGGGQRDAESLGLFDDTARQLRALPGASGPFRAKVASAAGWAALLFSGWRHVKYDRSDETGASRIRAFIARDLAFARRYFTPPPEAVDIAPCC